MIAEFVELFENYFDKLLGEDALNSPLTDAMRYACIDGGKRLRPTAVFLGASAVCEKPNLADVLQIASAIELIHAYSLVHDDLPSMDNDDMRRGKPSVHKVYGEANAILTGDRLLTLAMQILLGCAKDEKTSQAAELIAYSAGEMADGQYYDLLGMETADDFLTMYRMKTSALFEGAFTAGGVLGGAEECDLEALSEYATHLGLAFQIADDLLDNSDEKSYLTYSGEAKANLKLKEETELAIENAKKLKYGEILVQFANMLLSRKK